MDEHVKAYYEHLYWQAEAADAAAERDPEGTSAWSAAFETNDEHRMEMEADDARCGPFDPWGESA